MVIRMSQGSKDAGGAFSATFNTNAVLYQSRLQVLIVFKLVKPRDRNP
jgi:hypothetical protein